MFAWIAGWGKLALPGNYKATIGCRERQHNGYFWIPIVAPIVGAAFALLVYDFVIRDILVARGNVPTGGEEEARVVRETEADNPSA